MLKEPKLEFQAREWTGTETLCCAALRTPEAEAGGPQRWALVRDPVTDTDNHTDRTAGVGNISPLQLSLPENNSSHP